MHALTCSSSRSRVGASTRLPRAPAAVITLPRSRQSSRKDRGAEASTTNAERRARGSPSGSRSTSTMKRAPSQRWRARGRRARERQAPGPATRSLPQPREQAAHGDEVQHAARSAAGPRSDESLGFLAHWVVSLGENMIGQAIPQRNHASPRLQRWAARPIDTTSSGGYASRHWAMRAVAGASGLAAAVSNLRGPPRRPPEAGGSPLSSLPGRGRGYRPGRRCAITVEKVLLASPRGYCAGVERAVETVERALELYGAPVYVRKQIVHNIHVVRELEARGAIFVEDERRGARGRARRLLGARRRARRCTRTRRARGHRTIDATCPLVTKVHAQAQRYAADGYTIVLIGHAGHEEVVGTMGEAPDRSSSSSRPRRPTALDAARRARGSRTSRRRRSRSTRRREIIAALRRRFPDIHAPKKEDICYATSNRQWAVKEMLGEIDLLLVIGSRNCSNSNRLVEVARARGVAAHLIDDETRDRRGVARRASRPSGSRPARPRPRRSSTRVVRLVPRARRRGHRAVPARSRRT